METLESYLNRKIMSRMFKRCDFAALNMTKGDEATFKNDTAFAKAHGHSKQGLYYLAKNGAQIDDKGRVFSGSGSLSFVIKNYRGIGNAKASD